MAINHDLDNSLHGIRLFHEADRTNINEITNIIIKHSPNSIILKTQALKEYGKTAILLEIEKQLINLSNNLVPNLTLQLKSHLSSSGNELLGDLPFFSEYIKYFTSTLINFCTRTGKNQKTILYLVFDDKYFLDDFLGFIKPLIENLPEKLFIYIFVSSNKLSNSLFKYQSEPNYYWDHPTTLGSDLYFLLKNSPSALIEHLTNNEFSLLLRLWKLNDVAIPIGETVLQHLQNYSHQEISVLFCNESINLIINNADKYEAGYKIYRELAYHYASISNLIKANHYKDKALSIVGKSSISETLKIKYNGLIWGDYARFSKTELNLNEAIKALIKQKMIYKTSKDLFINELSLTSYNLGVCYRANKNYEQAIAELSFSIDTENRANNLDGEIEALLELGKTYIDCNEYEAALLIFEKINIINPAPKSLRTEYLRGLALAYIASIKIVLGDKKNAYDIALEALDIFSRVGADKDKELLRKLIKD